MPTAAANAGGENLFGIVTDMFEKSAKGMLAPMNL
jgi:hypothetical protein